MVILLCIIWELINSCFVPCNFEKGVQDSVFMHFLKKKNWNLYFKIDFDFCSLISVHQNPSRITRFHELDWEKSTLHVTILLFEKPRKFVYEFLTNESMFFKLPFVDTNFCPLYFIFIFFILFWSIWSKGVHSLNCFKPINVLVFSQKKLFLIYLGICLLELATTGSMIFLMGLIQLTKKAFAQFLLLFSTSPKYKKIYVQD